MSAATPSELDDILDRVRGWEPASRVLLARRILETVGPPAIGVPPRVTPARRAFGLLKTAGPPPTDEEVDEILAEERLRKHG